MGKAVNGGRNTKQLMKRFVTFIMVGFFIVPLFYVSEAHSASARSQFNQAVKILESRGFNKYAVHTSLAIYLDIYGFSKHRIRKSYSRLVEKYRKKSGIKENSMLNSALQNMGYNPTTGYSLYHKNIVTFAKSIPSCMKRRRPWRDCKLVYHPVDGCFLTTKQRNICARGGREFEKVEVADDAGKRYDFQFGKNGADCWQFVKGPAVILPYQAASQSQIKLAKAKIANDEIPISKKKKTFKKKTNNQKKIRISQNTLGRPVCKDAGAWGPPY